jgi:hypothetical protein
VRPALRQFKLLSDFAERHGAGTVSEELNDGQASFSGYVSHLNKSLG